MKFACLAATLLIVATACATEPGKFEWKEAAKGTPLTAQLAEAAKASAKAGMTPVLYVHADWCGPCKAIDKGIKDARMRDAFANTWVVRVDADAFEAELKSAGVSVTSIPLFVKLDASGKPTARRIDGSAWGDNIPENMAPPLKTFFAAR